MGIRPLQWSRNQAGTANGKVGPLTLATVAWHTGDRRWFVSMKLPGSGQAVPVGSEAEGRARAEQLYEQFVAALVEGAP